VTNHLLRRLLVGATLALAAGATVVVTAAAPALAITSTSNGASAVTMASWGAAGAPVGGPATIGSPYVVTWSGGALGAQYLQISNTGSIALTGQTYTATNSKTTNGQAPPVVALDACVGAAWNTLLGTCPGTIVRLTSTDQASSTTTTPIAADGALSVRIQPVTLVNFPQSYNTNITVSVTRSQARTATTTRS
jgi:hypothetical protein